MGRIQSKRPSARCPFSYTIMEKGGYWVGVSLIYFSIQFFFFLIWGQKTQYFISYIGFNWLNDLNRLMGKVASDKCHKWVFKEPSECEPNISNYWQSSFDAVCT